MKRHKFTHTGFCVSIIYCDCSQLLSQKPEAGILIIITRRIIRRIMIRINIWKKMGLWEMAVQGSTGLIIKRVALPVMSFPPGRGSNETEGSKINHRDFS